MDISSMAFSLDCPIYSFNRCGLSVESTLVSEADCDWESTSSRPGRLDLGSLTLCVPQGSGASSAGAFSFSGVGLELLNWLGIMVIALLLHQAQHVFAQ